MRGRLGFLAAGGLLGAAVLFGGGLVVDEARRGLAALRAGRPAAAREAFRSALARAGLRGERPGYLLDGLARAEAAAGRRREAFRALVQALRESWGAPAGWPWPRAEAWAHLGSWLPPGVTGTELGRARQELLGLLRRLDRHRDPAVRLAALAVRQRVDPGTPGLAAAWAAAEAACAREELAWRVGSPRTLSLRGPRSGFAWWGRAPERRAGRVVLRAGAAAESAFFAALEEVGGSWVLEFTVDRREAARWGVVYGLTEDRPAYRFLLEGRTVRWVDGERRLLYACRLPEGLPRRVCLRLEEDRDADEVRLHLGPRRMVRVPRPPVGVERPAGGVFVRRGRLRLLQVRLAAERLR